MIKKKYLKYLSFFVIPLLSINIFISEVAAAETCSYTHSSNAYATFATSFKGFGTTTKTLYSITVSDGNTSHTAFCLKGGTSIGSNLQQYDCTSSALGNVTNAATIARAKKAAVYCKGKTCNDASTLEYAIAQAYVWFGTQNNMSDVSQLICEVSVKKGTLKYLKTPSDCKSMIGFDDADEVSHTAEQMKKFNEFDKLSEKAKTIITAIDKTSIGSSEFVCLQDKSHTTQPLLILKENFKVCEEETKYYCYDENNKSVNITNCVNECSKKDTVENCKNSCTEKEESCQEKFYCPKDSDHPDKDITTCVKKYAGSSTAYQKCIDEEKCYDNDICKGVNYEYVGETPVCTDDGVGKTVSFSQQITGEASTAFTGSEKGYGTFEVAVGTYGVLYCRETAATINLPGGLNSSIRLGGYLIWPTYDNGDTKVLASTGFGTMYPLSFQGEMECYYQVAPDVSKNSEVSCNANAAEDYKKAYNELKNAAYVSGTTTMAVDTIEVPSGYEATGLTLDKYLGITAAARDKHNREDIRTFSRSSYTYQSCSYTATVKESTETTVTNDIVLYDTVYMKKEESGSLTNTEWKNFVKNYSSLNSSLKNATVITDFSKVDITKTGTYSYTLKYTTSKASPASYTTKTGTIEVVDTIPNSLGADSVKVPEPTKTCQTIKADADNTCLTKTESGCNSKYFDTLENWRSSNESYWTAKYTNAIRTCQKNKTKTIEKGCTTWEDGSKHNCSYVTRPYTESECRSENVYSSNDYYKKKNFWKDTAKSRISTIKTNFNTYAEKFNVVVETYLEIWRIPYDTTLSKCTGSGVECQVYKFMSGATVEYTDDSVSGYTSYGSTLQLEQATTLSYECKTNGGFCGDTPLTEMYPNIKNNGVYDHSYETWSKTLYGNKTFNDIITNMTPDYVSGKIGTINSTVSTITTNEVYYKLKDDDLYNYVSKGTTTDYYKTLPSGKSYYYLGFGVLPTSYGNTPGYKYDLILTDIIVGDEGAVGTEGTGAQKTIDKYTCYYKVTNDYAPPLVCPPGTKYAGMILDLVQISSNLGREVSYEEAVELYCDNYVPPTCGPVCYTCTNSSGAKIDITKCVENNGGDISKCEEKYCPSNRYYCPTSTYYSGKEITNCVLYSGNTQTQCEKLYCYKGSGEKLFIYRTIDLQNPFPSKDADATVTNKNYKHYFNLDVIGRKPGSNWFSGYIDDNTAKYSYVYTKILNNRDVSDYEIYDETPLYHFELDTATIKKIRSYNSSQMKSGGYADYDLTCVQNINNKYNGIACVSKFLHTTDNNISGLVKSKSSCGSVSGATDTNGLISCLYD